MVSIKENLVLDTENKCDEIKRNNDEYAETYPLKHDLYDEDKKEKHKNNENLTIIQRLKLIKENATVEPIMACYIIPSTLASLATQNLNLEKACRVNLNFTNEICDALKLRQTENYTEYEEHVQTYIAGMQTWKNIVQTVIPVLIILFVGAWSDKTGRRKACILMPIVGEFIACIGFIINTYFFYELPVEITALTESIFTTIFGGWFTNTIGVYSYIGDITTTEDRTYRVGIINLCMSMGYPIGSALSGILLTWMGYYGIFSLSALLYLFSLIYGYFNLEDTKRKTSKTKRNGCIAFICEFFDFKLVTETFKVAFRKRPGNRRLRVCLLLITLCIVYGPSQGDSNIMYLFTRYRFNWDEVQYSVWMTYYIITDISGTFFSMSIFSKYLKLDDTLLGIISCTSKIVSSFGYAFARTNLEIYLAPLLDILNGTSFIAIRSIGSKIVSDEEFGKVNSLFGLVEAMSPLVYSPLYARTYMATLNVLPGAVFLMGSLLTLPAFAILGWLYFEHRQDKRTTATSSSDTEKIEICNM